MQTSPKTKSVFPHLVHGSPSPSKSKNILIDISGISDDSDSSDDDIVWGCRGDPDKEGAHYFLGQRPIRRPSNLLAEFPVPPLHTLPGTAAGVPSVSSHLPLMTADEAFQRYAKSRERMARNVQEFQCPIHQDNLISLIHCPTISSTPRVHEQARERHGHTYSRSYPSHNCQRPVARHASLSTRSFGAKALRSDAGNDYGQREVIFYRAKLLEQAPGMDSNMIALGMKHRNEECHTLHPRRDQAHDAGFHPFSRH